MTDYLAWLERERGLRFADFAALWRWSVDDLEAFWCSVVDYYGIPLRGAWDRALGQQMPGARWFEGAELNYAEALFRRGWQPIVRPSFPSERLPFASRVPPSSRASVAAVAAGLRRLGVGRGDRVVAVIPNIPEAVVAFLACASLGAIWASCSPDFGTRGLIDRFGQIAPKVLLAVDGYTYGGKHFDRRDVSKRCARRSHARTDRADAVPRPRRDRRRPGEMAWADLVAGPAEPLTFEPVPFDHPLWVLYSSGTTGLPKAIVHGHGGVVLEHSKALGLMFDVRDGDRMFWFTTTGWMMWNFLVGRCWSAASPVLYDGSPGYPDLGVLWELGGRGTVTCSGRAPRSWPPAMKAGSDRASARLSQLARSGRPARRSRSRRLRLGLRRGQARRLARVDERRDRRRTAFVGGCPLLPVHAGELQARALGRAVEAFDEDGRSVVGETGELVLTAPLPSMPLFFWNDPDGTRYRESYFETYPGVWRHGDWIRITERGSAVIEGRSDSTLNRQGIRFGTSELYRVVEGLPEIADSLVIGLELPGGRYWMPLFVVLADGVELDDALEGGSRARSATRSRSATSPTRSSRSRPCHAR